MRSFARSIAVVIVLLATLSGIPAAFAEQDIVWNYEENLVQPKGAGHNWLASWNWKVVPDGIQSPPRAGQGSLSSGSRDRDFAENFSGSVVDYGFAKEPWNFISEKEMIQMKEAGHNWIRYWAWWASMEKAPGEIDWTVSDDFFAKAKRNGIRVYVSFYTAPRWATGGEAWGEWGHCDATGHEWNFAENLPECANPTGRIDEAALRTFVRKYMERYFDQIFAVGGWNEPSGLGGWPWAWARWKKTTEPNWLQAQFYEDIAWQIYLPLYAEAKLVNPNIKVVGPDEYQIEGFRAIMALEKSFVERGFPRFFDVVSVHPYGVGDVEHYPESAFRELDEEFIPASLLLGPRELWVTETGFKWDMKIPGYPLQGEELQAERLRRLWEGMWARRRVVTRLFLYRPSDGWRSFGKVGNPNAVPPVDFPNSYGVLSGIGGPPRLAYYAIKEAAEKIKASVSHPRPAR